VGVLLASLAALGCAEAPGALPKSAAGSSDHVGGTVEVVNHVHWPFETMALFVRLDEAIPPLDIRTSERRIIRTMPLEVGERYWLSLTAAFRAADPDESDPCIITVQDARWVEVRALPATIRVDVYLRDPTVPFDRRPDVAVALENVQPLPKDFDRLTFDDRACRGLEPVERALCRAKTGVTDVERKRDIVGALCMQGIAEKIADLAVQVDGVRVARLQAGDPAAKDDGKREATLVRDIEALSADLDGCFHTAPGEPPPRVTSYCPSDNIYDHWMAGVD
jgi:hypothetical protein